MHKPSIRRSLIRRDLGCCAQNGGHAAVEACGKAREKFTARPLDFFEGEHRLGLLRFGRSVATANETMSAGIRCDRSLWQVGANAPLRMSTRRERPREAKDPGAFSLPATLTRISHSPSARTADSSLSASLHDDFAPQHSVQLCLRREIAVRLASRPLSAVSRRRAVRNAS